MQEGGCWDSMHGWLPTTRVPQRAKPVEILIRCRSASSPRMLEALRWGVAGAMESTGRGRRHSGSYSRQAYTYTRLSCICHAYSSPHEVKPPTGEPDAGDPHVRFGGRGGASRPYPYLIERVPCEQISLQFTKRIQRITHLMTTLNVTWFKIKPRCLLRSRPFIPLMENNGSSGK